MPWDGIGEAESLVLSAETLQDKTIGCLIVHTFTVLETPSVGSMTPCVPTLLRYIFVYSIIQQSIFCLYIILDLGSRGE